MNLSQPARLFTISLAVFATQAAYAQRDLTDIPAPDPELEKATFVLPEGFEVNLFAADPQIAKPIHINFDPQGRLWIASSETYPQIKPGEVQNDKVLVLEDVDHDGVSDSIQVFADGLLIPTGVAPGDGGAYVANSTQLVHFRDTDGDGKADDKRIVLSGFGTEDTHHIIHTFGWGPDSHLYFGQSIYIHAHIETPWGVKRLNAGGFWRYQPDNEHLNVLFKGLVNPWGLAFNEYGQTFATDGAGGEGINHIVPGAYYKTAFQPPRLLDGLNPGSPKHCGLEMVDGPNLPEDFQGSLIAHDFRGHRVCRFVLADSGSGFRSNEQVELIKSDHVAFRPVDVKQGPDGAIYIADWYNPIIQHGEVDFRDERRDKTHGRIWRVTYKGQTVPPKDFTKSTVDELLNTLHTGTSYQRHQARRVLHEKAREERAAGGSEVVDKMTALRRTMDQTVPHYWRTRLEFLWLQQGLGVIDAESLDFTLRCPDAGARAGATRILTDVIRDQVELDRPDMLDPYQLLSYLVVDADPKVRMEAIRVLAESDRADAIVTAMTALDLETDTNLDYSLWLMARETASQWLPKLVDGELQFKKPGHAVYALAAAGGAQSASALLTLLNEGKVPDELAGETLAAIGQHASPQQLGEVLAIATSEGRSNDFIATALSAVADSATRRKISLSDGLAKLGDLLKRDEAIASAAADAAGALNAKQLVPTLLEVLGGGESESLRVRAAQSLVRLGDGSIHQQVMDKAMKSESPQMKAQLLATLVPVRPGQVAIELVKQAEDFQPTESARPLLEAFASRPKLYPALLKAVADKSLPSDFARLGLSILRSAGPQADEVANAFAKAGNIVSGPRTLSPEEMSAFAAKVTSSGDAHRGEEIFRRGRLACLKCHAVGGAGGIIGPELRSLGATAPIDYIVEALLNPNAKVKEGYNTTLIVTAEGKVVSGIKLRETEEQVVLRDAEGREVTIDKDNIDAEQPGQSLMPVGTIDELTDSDLVDLVTYLKALGTLPEFTVEPRNFVRTWQTMQSTPDAAYALRRHSYAHAVTDDNRFVWAPGYVRVNGSLPLADLPVVTVKNRSAAGNRGVGFLRSNLELDKSGLVTFRVSSPEGLSLWIDDKPIELAAEITVDLPAGVHRVTLAVDSAARSEPVSLEADQGVWK